MPETCFHPSIEGAQHGAKSLTQFLDYAKASGAAGAQPSNFMLEKGNGFKTAEEIQEAFATRGLALDGISAHCPFWVHTTAWTSSPTVRPFLPPDVAQKSAAAIEQWSEDYLQRLLDLAAALGVKIIPMFWGVAFGWELATGYPWGFLEGRRLRPAGAGPGTVCQENGETARPRQRAGHLSRRTKSIPAPPRCARTISTMLAQICGGDKCLAVNADPSHCWEGEDWETRFLEGGAADLRLPRQEYCRPPRPAVAHDGAGLAEARDAVCGHFLRAN